MFGDKIKGFEPYIPFTYTSGQIRLDANESPYDLPYSIKEEIFKRIRNLDFDRYPDPSAKKLCSAFADYYGVNEDCVVAGNGSDELLSLILSVSLKKGGVVTVTKPDFSMYSFYSTLGENDVRVFDKGTVDGFDVMNFAEFAKGSEVVIFSNPCNPTGQILSAKDVLTLADNVEGLLIVDEAYMDFADESVITDASKRKNLMVLKTLSKSFGCASVRVGFAVSSKENVDVIKTLKSPYNLNSISQVIGEIILKNKPLAKKRVESIKASRDILYGGLCAYNNADFVVYPTFANFVYVKTSKAQAIADKLLQKGIVVRCFKDALRISAGLPEEVERLLEVFKEISDILK